MLLLDILVQVWESGGGLKCTKKQRAESWEKEEQRAESWGKEELKAESWGEEQRAKSWGKEEETQACYLYWGQPMRNQ
jgi:hypothetical protein